MKSKKESAKQSALPTQDESRRTNVLMEKMYSEFRVFGESLSIVRQRVDRMEPKLDKVIDDLEITIAAVRSHGELLGRLH
jgi:hypothetical protein